MRGAAYYFFRAFPALIVMLLLFFLPLFSVLSEAFSDGGRNLIDVFTSKRTYSLLAFTLSEALLSALISVLLSIPFAAYFSSYSFPLRRGILSFSALSFVLPSILVVLGFVMWYGNSGAFNTLIMRLFSLERPIKFLYSFSAIILAHVYLNLPVAFSLITSSWSSESNREEEMAKILGKKRMRIFFSITLPKIKGSVIAAFILIFLFSFSSFSIVMVLGGQPRYYTLEAEIYRRTYMEANRASSSALSVFVFLVTTLILFLTSSGRKTTKIARKERTLIRAKGASLFISILLSLLLLSFLLPPLLLILYRSFFSRDGIFTLSAWKSLFTSRVGLISSSLYAILNSLSIALATALLSVYLASLISIFATKRGSRAIEVISSLPMATGSVTLGLGFSFLSSKLTGHSIATSYMLVLLSHLVITLPFATRTILPGARRIDEKIPYSSYTLGASKAKTLRMVESPLLTAYKKRAFAFSFALSLGEVNATLTLSEGRVTTLPVLLFRLIESYNYQGASALGTILLAEALFVFMLGEFGTKE